MMTDRIKELMAMDEKSLCVVVIDTFPAIYDVADENCYILENSFADWAFRARDMACSTLNGMVLYEEAMFEVWSQSDWSEQIGVDNWVRSKATPTEMIVAAIVAMEKETV